MQFLWARLNIPDHVIVIEIFRRFGKNDKHFAAYMQQDDDCEFTITFDRSIVNDPDETYYIETLAHELAHVSQYVTGRMVDKGKNLVLWEGQEIDERITDYWLTPWEIEARQLQHDLTLEWLEYRKAKH